MRERIGEIEEFVEGVRDAGFNNALLLGMGGSSLAPEVFRMVFGFKKGYLDLGVLDSTHPDAIRAVRESIEPSKTLFIVSTKSGGTVETFSFMKYFFSYISHKPGVEYAGEHFIAITDPGSKLEETGRELNFRKIFLNDPNIGGRYSALSFFGLVPAALLGVDLPKLLDRARIRSDKCLADHDNPGALLGIIMGELAKSGKDKLTLLLSPRIAPFGAWIEQLIAESTGKEGKGILPVVGEEILSPRDYGADRLFIYIGFSSDKKYDNQIAVLKKAGFPVVEMQLDDLYDIGGEYFRWEMATAVAGWRLGIHPFDQPNVESAKIRAREMLSAYMRGEDFPEALPGYQDDDTSIFGEVRAKTASQALADFIDSLNSDSAVRPYVAIQAYLKPSIAADIALHELRTNIQKLYKVATTVGYGPRFLHSTGQLHKGDSGKGLFIIFTDDPDSEERIPDEAGDEKSGFDFGVLIKSQALGDRQALLDSKRKVLHIHFKSDAISGIKKLAGGLAWPGGRAGRNPAAEDGKEK